MRALGRLPDPDVRVHRLRGVVGGRDDGAGGGRRGVGGEVRRLVPASQWVTRPLNSVTVLVTYAFQRDGSCTGRVCSEVGLQARMPLTDIPAAFSGPSPSTPFGA
jgi:hypothetical protein